jgi:hypothetical protein
MSTLENALTAILALLALALLGGAIAPRYYCALMRRWYELCGMNYDVLIKSERRHLIVTRLACGIGFIAEAGMAASVICMCSR